MRKRLSGRGIVVLFVVSLIAGIVLRGFVFPPAPTFSAIETKMIGTWDGTDQQGNSTNWKFNDQREVQFRSANGGDGWTGAWRLREPTLDLSERLNLRSKEELEDLQLEVQFADNPNEATFKFTDGTSIRARRR